MIRGTMNSGFVVFQAGGNTLPGAFANVYNLRLKSRMEYNIGHFKIYRKMRFSEHLFTNPMFKNR